MKKETIKTIALLTAFTVLASIVIIQRFKTKAIIKEIEDLNDQSKNIHIAVKESEKANKQMKYLVDIITKIGEDNKDESKETDESQQPTAKSQKPKAKTQPQIKIKDEK